MSAVKQKQISLADLTQLRKLMGMTGSDADGEALNALRMANRLLKKSDLSWADILDRCVTASAANGSGYTTSTMRAGADDGFDEERGEDNLDETIQNAFDELRGVMLSPSFRAFVDDVERKWNQTGYLTPGQRAPILKAVKNVRERRRRDE